MEGWTRAQAIADVVLASDGFGRAYGPDLEVPDHIEDFQPCVVELARHLLHLKKRGVLERLLNPPTKICARPGCPAPVTGKKKRYCSSTCGIREERRKSAERRREREREAIRERRRCLDEYKVRRP